MTAATVQDDAAGGAAVATAGDAQAAASFAAPEGVYQHQHTFPSPPPLAIVGGVTPAAGASAVATVPVNSPRISTVSVRYPLSNKPRDKAAANKDGQKAASKSAKLGGGDQAESSTGSDTSTSGIDSAAVGQAPLSGPLLEAPLAAQGVDAPSFCLTGGLHGVTGMAAFVPTYGASPSSQPASSFGATFAPRSDPPPAQRKLSRPKGNLKSTSSSFVNRVQVHSDSAKVLANRESSDMFTLLSHGKSFFFLADTMGRVKEPILRITFAAAPTCHDVNQHTRSSSALDVIIGFTTGDIIWLDPLQSRYTRINKGGLKSCVTQIRWLPGSETHFLASHEDGSMVIYDREREDASPGSWAPSDWTGFGGSRRGGGSASQPDEDLEVLAPSASTRSRRERLDSSSGRSDVPSRSSTPANGSAASALQRAFEEDADDEHENSTLAAWNPRECILVTHPGGIVNAAHGGAASNGVGGPALYVVPLSSEDGGASSLSRSVSSSGSSGVPGLNLGNGKGKEIQWSKLNPVSHWRVARRKVTDFALSPDFVHVAVTAEDGVLRIIDLLSERLLETFDSYFGSLQCACWSPDGRLLLTGGQDDLVTIFAPREGRIVARCQGHSSFVRGVAFDPWRWRPEDRTYRFASVGEDCRLILWDFSAAALGRPKHHHAAAGSMHGVSGPRRVSMGSSSPSLAPGRPSLHGHTNSGSAGGGASNLLLAGAIRRTHSNHSGAVDVGSPPATARPGDDVPQSPPPTATPAGATWHAAPPRSDISLLQPIVVHQLGADSLAVSVRFRPDGLSVLHRNGALDHFARPKPRGSAPLNVVPGR